MTYTILACDAVTDALIGAVPVQTFSWTEVLNRAGSMSATVRYDRTPLREMLQAGKTALYVYKDDLPMWGGVLYTVEADSDSKTLSLGAEGFFEHLNRLEVYDTVKYVATDQTTLATDLVLNNLYATTEDRHLGVEVPVPVASGQLRDRTWYWFDKHQLGKLVTDMSNLINGFDYSLDVELISGVRARVFRVYYPRRGSILSMVADARQIVGMSETLDAKEQVRQVTALGAGDGDSRLDAVAIDADSSYPMSEQSYSYSDIKEATTLQDRALQDLQRLRYPTRIIRPVLRPNQEVQVGSFRVGDVIKVQYTDEWFQVDGTYRVIECRVAVDENGQETMTLGVVEELVF